MDSGTLQAQLGSLVDAAVSRVLQQYGGELLPSAAAAPPAVQGELQAARRQVGELKATLAEVLEIDNAEIKRLWATIVELEHTCAGLRAQAAAAAAVDAPVPAQAGEAAAPEPAESVPSGLTTDAAALVPAAAAAGAGAADAADSPSAAVVQQLQSRLEELERAMDRLQARAAEREKERQHLQQQAEDAAAALATRTEQLSAAQRELAAAREQAAQAAAREQALRQQLRAVQHAVSGGPTAAAAAGQQPAAATAAAAAAGGGGAAAAAAAAAAASLPQLLQGFKEQIEASLRAEVAAAMSAAAAAQHGEQPLARGSAEPAARLSPAAATAAANSNAPPGPPPVAAQQQQQQQQPASASPARTAPAPSAAAAASPPAVQTRAAAAATSPLAVQARPAAAASRQQLQRWQQVMAQHADNAAGLPPPGLPFSTTAADPEEAVRQIESGARPYCCQPCRLVFESELALLEHQLLPTHTERCVRVFSAYTGNNIVDGQIQKVAGGRPLVESDRKQRTRKYCCLACRRTIQLEQYVHHLCTASHAKKVSARLRALAASPAKRQRLQ